MKKIFSSIVLTLAMVSSFMACQEYKIDSQPEAPLALQVDAQDTYTLLATSPSKIVFNVSANTPWTIESDQQWCVPSPAMSAASALVSEIIVTTEDNNERTSRTATLTVSAEGVAESVVITIVQASKENLVVIPYDGTVGTDGGTFSFTIVSNKPWEIIPSTAFISNIDKKSGEGKEGTEEEVVTVTVPANTGSTRRGTLTVQTEYDSYSFEVVQSGFLLELAGVPSTNVISLEGEGLATEFITEVNTNLDWKAQVPAEYSDWLAVEREGNSIKVLAKMNNRMTVRKGQFLLTTATPMDGFEGVVYYVEQPTNLFTLGSDTEAVFDETTGSVKLKLAKGKEHLTTNDMVNIAKGRVVVEFENYIIGGSATYLGFQFTTKDGGGTIKFRREADNKYVFNGGGSLWVSALKKTPEEFGVLEQDIKKFEIVIEDHPSKTGVQVSLYINDTLFGTWTKETTIFEDGQTMKFCLDCLGQSDMSTTCHCIVKSITFYPAE